MSVYLYGMIRRPRGSAGRASLGTGIGDPPVPVRLLGYRDLAAVVSALTSDLDESADVRTLRRDLAAHNQTVNRILNGHTVLPAGFGMAFPDEQALIEGLLEPEYPRLLKTLNQLTGKVELAVRAEYVEEQIIARVIREQPQLAANAHTTSGYHQRIELGRQLASAISDCRQSDWQRLLDALLPVCADVAITDSNSDLTVLRASFLVPGGNLERFDRILQQLQQEAGSCMRLACVGPLPPYSFVDLRAGAGASR